VYSLHNDLFMMHIPLTS